MYKTLKGIIKAGKENPDTKVEGEEEDFACICKINLVDQSRLAEGRK